MHVKDVSVVCGRQKPVEGLSEARQWHHQTFRKVTVAAEERVQTRGWGALLGKQVPGVRPEAEIMAAGLGMERGGWGRIAQGRNQQALTFD